MSVPSIILVLSQIVAACACWLMFRANGRVPLWAKAALLSRIPFHMLLAAYWATGEPHQGWLGWVLAGASGLMAGTTAKACQRFQIVFRLP